MRTFLLFLFIFCIQSDINAQTCSTTCNRIPFSQYTPGMIFYFPFTSSGSIDALFTSRCTKLTSYNQVAGKKYVIKDTSSFKDKLYYDRFRPDNHGNPSNDRTQRLYFISMENIADPTDKFEYEISIDSAIFLSSPKYPTLQDNAYIQGAIADDEFEATKKWLLGLPKIYTLFEVGGKKYEEVQIIYVIPGTWETPLGVIYKSTSSSVMDIVYLNLCGTNVPDNYINIFHFTKYFTCDNPQGEIPDSKWTLIRSGNPSMDMSEGEVILTLGKPNHIEKTLERNTTKVVYTFSKYVVHFENSIIVKITSKTD